MRVRGVVVERLEGRRLLSVATLFGVRATAVDDEPSAIAVADFNADGKLDVLTANANANEITIMAGNGDGTFAIPPRAFVMTSGAFTYPDAVAVADLNADGRPDVVASGDFVGGTVISVFINQGNFTFKDPLVINSVDVRGLTLADVNNDTRPDIITTDPFGKNAAVRLANANGTYRPPQTFDAGTTPQAVIARDFNADGNLDLAVANLNDDTVSLLKGNGNGTFQAQQTFAVGHRPSDLAARDFDGDGKLDLVMPDAGDDTVTLLLGNGDGTFKPQATFAVGDNPISLTVGDVNGDGKRDLVTADSIGVTHTLSVLLGNGDGTFQPHRTFNAATSPKAVATGDLNNDGRLDLVTANASSSVVKGTVALYLGNGDGTFPAQSHFAVGPQPRSVATADFDHDGRQDVAVANLINSTVGVLLGRGDGTLEPQKIYPVGSQPYSIVAADVNGDSFDDLVVANSLSSSVGVLLNQKNGSFAPQQAFAVGNRPQCLAVGDIDGDGRMDLAASNWGASTVSILKGNGDGTFQPQLKLTVDASPEAVAIGDATGDGNADVVAVSASAGRAVVLPGNADFTFQAARYFTTSDDPTSLLLTDVNGDGRRDIVTASDSIFDVGVLIANAVGGFQNRRLYYLGHTAAAIAAADVNGDGRTDLVTVNGDQNTASVLLNGGTLPKLFPATDPLDFNLGNDPDGVALADLNNDGRVDLVTADSNSASVSTVLNLGNGAPLATLSAGTLTVNLYDAGGPLTFGRDTISGMLTVTGPGGATASFAPGAVNMIVLRGTSAADGVTFAAAPAAPVTYFTGGGSDTLTVLAGNLALAAGDAPAAPAVYVAANAAVTFTNPQHLAALHLAENARATLASGGAATLVIGPDLALAAGARLDLADNDLIVRGGSLPDVAAAIAAARTPAGDWSGPGITSSVAAANHNATLAVARAGDLQLSNLGSDPLDAADVLVRLTLPGDATFDRTVDFNDLVKLAQNYNTTGATTYAGGDFNGDGHVDFNDLVILAQHYNTALPAAAAMLAAPPPQKPRPATKKPDPIFSVTPVARPAPLKQTAPAQRAVRK